MTCSVASWTMRYSLSSSHGFGICNSYIMPNFIGSPLSRSWFRRVRQAPDDDIGHRPTHPLHLQGLAAHVGVKGEAEVHAERHREHGPAVEPLAHRPTGEQLVGVAVGAVQQRHQTLPVERLAAFGEQRHAQQRNDLHACAADQVVHLFEAATTGRRLLLGDHVAGEPGQLGDHRLERFQHRRFEQRLLRDEVLVERRLVHRSAFGDLLGASPGVAALHELGASCIHDLAAALLAAGAPHLRARRPRR